MADLDTEILLLQEVCRQGPAGSDSGAIPYPVLRTILLEAGLPFRKVGRDIIVSRATAAEVLRRYEANGHSQFRRGPYRPRRHTEPSQPETVRSVA